MKTALKIYPSHSDRKLLQVGTFAALLLTLPLATPLAATDSASDSTAADASTTDASKKAQPEAESLYAANCTKCHGTEVYTRDDRMIKSMAGLESQVRRCESSLELQWFDDQIMDVTQLLNDRYYHFQP